MDRFVELLGQCNGGAEAPVAVVKQLVSEAAKARGNPRSLAAAMDAIEDQRNLRLARTNEMKREDLKASEARDFDVAMAECDAIGDLAHAFDLRYGRIVREFHDGANRMPAVMRTGGQAGEAAVWLPSLREYRALSVGTDAQGGYTVGEEQSRTIYDLLASQSVMLGLPGIQTLRMAASELNVPILSASATAAMTAEGKDIDESDLTFRGVKMAAKKAAARVIASSEVFADSTADLRAFVQRDLVRTVSLKVDHGFLEGDGSGGNLMGLKSLSGVATTTISRAILPDDVLDAINRVKAANGVPSAIIAHPTVIGQLIKAKSGDGNYYLVPGVAAAGASSMFGLPFVASSQITVTGGVGGDESWCAVVDASQLVLGRRQEVNVLLDPYSYAKSDQVQIVLTARFAGLIVLNAGAVEIIGGITV